MHAALRRHAATLLFVVAAAACGGGGQAANSVGQDISIDVQVAPGSAQTIRLSGIERGRGSVGVVLAHMLGSQQAAWTPLMPALLDADFHVLTFDFRGHALSGGTRDPSSADLDLAGAVAKLRALGATKIFVVGASMGGTAAIKVAASGTIAGVVSISAPLKIDKLDASTSASKLRAPSLFIVGKGDDARYTSAAQSFYRSAPEPKMLQVIDGTTSHGTELLSGSVGSRVRKLIVNFLVLHRG